jgi:hypothetical protein
VVEVDDVVEPPAKVVDVVDVLADPGGRVVVVVVVDVVVVVVDSDVDPAVKVKLFGPAPS